MFSIDPNARSRMSDSIIGITADLEGLKMQANGDDHKVIADANKNGGHLPVPGKSRKFEVSKIFAGLTTLPKT
jgi:hypothetical protein